MYRIHFVPNPGIFILQVLHLGIWWSSIKTVEGKFLAFTTYGDAADHAQRIGLTKLYENKSANTRPGFDRAVQS